eukprot:Skav225561  [mRNA]  locus=scaffold81:412788:413284:- [translate_table: standard]
MISGALPRCTDASKISSSSPTGLHPTKSKAAVALKGRATPAKPPLTGLPLAHTEGEPGATIIPTTVAVGHFFSSKSNARPNAGGDIAGSPKSSRQLAPDTACKSLSKELGSAENTCT